MSVANGTRLLNLGDDLGALLWYAEALRLDAGDPTTERDHRVRLGTILRKVPILLQAWSRDGLANAIFSSDGNYVAVLGDQGRVAVFDADTFESIGPAVQHRVDTKYAHILFTPDSRRLISVGASLICVWEVGSGSLLGEYAHPSVSAAAVSPDGTLLATSSTDGTSKFWELDSDRMILSVQDEPSQRRYVQFSRDGRVLTAGLREILIRDPISGKTDFERHFDQDVNGAVFSLDGTLLASAHDDHARVWDARVGDPITKRLPHQAPVSVLEFSPDGRTLVSACADFAVRLWSIPAGVLLTDDPRHDNFIMDAAFGPDGRLLVTSGTDGTARVWDLETMQRIGPPLRHAGYVRLALWHPDGRRILTAGHDGQTRIWDLGSDRRHVRPWAGHATTPLLASRDGRWLVSQNSRYEVEVWDTERWQRRGPPVRHGNPVAFSAISDGGERLLTVGVHDPDGSEWRVWEIHSASLVSRAVAQVPARLKFRVDGDFRTAAAIRADGSGLMVRPATGELSGLKHEGPIARIALSPDGNRIAASCEDWRIHVWDARGLQERYPAIQASGPPNYLEFSRNSRWLAVACGDKYLAEREAQVWEVATGMPAGPPIRHARSLSFATFNGESDRLLTGGDDLTARVWDFHSGVAISPRLVTIGHVIAGAFARDSRWVATGRSGAVYLWSARLGQPLTPQMPLLRQTDTLRFVDSDRALLTGTGVGAQLWNLAPDERPMEDLVRLAQLLSGHSIDNTGVFEPLPVAALRERWVSLQRNYPEEFEWVPDGANLIPLFAESTLRWNFKRRSPDASIAFDVINREDGLVERFNTDGVTEPVTVDGVACRRAVRQAGKGNFLYLAIAPVRKSERPVDVMVEVEYFDGVDGRFYVQYDAAPNEGGEGQAYARSMESRRLQSSRQWRSAWFRLPRARFANSQNVQADFRLAIEAPELCVRRVTVAGLPRFDGTSPIPARLPQTSARLLDLSNFYTTGFLGNWHGDQTDNDLSELPTGVQTFGGVEFDVRGLIQLRGANSGSRAFPDKVTGLPIGRRCARLHFLHSAIWGTVADGTLIGHYMILYADGGTDSIPIVLGGNVRDWWSHPNEPPLPGTMKIAWRGANGKSRIENAEIRLFQTSWANPRPDQVIQSIDFVSAQAAAAPFLIAISLEP